MCFVVAAIVRCSKSSPGGGGTDNFREFTGAKDLQVTEVKLLVSQPWCVQFVFEDKPNEEAYSRYIFEVSGSLRIEEGSRVGSGVDAKYLPPASTASARWRFENDHLTMANEKHEESGNIGTTEIGATTSILFYVEKDSSEVWYPCSAK